MKFEGQDVVGFEAKIPSITVDTPESYKYGLHLKLEVEVRVNGVHYKESNDGTLTRVHNLSYEDIVVVEAVDPATQLGTVVGTLAGGGEDDDEGGDVADLGIGRTSELAS